jgi:hypothetical protein
MIQALFNFQSIEIVQTMQPQLSGFTTFSSWQKDTSTHRVIATSTDLQQLSSEYEVAPASFISTSLVTNDVDLICAR